MFAPKRQNGVMTTQAQAPSGEAEASLSGSSVASGFVTLPRSGRTAVLVLLSVIMLIDIIAYSVGSSTTWRSIVFALAPSLATALFAWRPPVAALVLLLTALVQTAVGHDGSQLLFLSAVAGVVVYTSPLWFLAMYITAGSSIAFLSIVSPGPLAQSAFPALGVVLAVSMAVGWALRTAHGRERRFAIALADLEQARADAIKAERERISDELHDIIAHDVTLVSMHARVLERVNDPALWDQSVRAIRSSADQALADIRRVLRIVRDDQFGVVSPEDGEHVSVASALDDAHAALADLGADVAVRDVPELIISHSIEQALVRVLREAVTNIVKHSSGRPLVTIDLGVSDGLVRLTVENTLSNDLDAVQIPSSGYGLDRLRERVSLLGGELSAQSGDGVWILVAHLPVR